MSDIEFHHFGLAVREFSEALRFHQNLGYRCSDPLVDPMQDVELIMCVSDRYPAVELIRPTSDNSPVVGYLKKGDATFYHLCYEVDDADSIGMLFPDNRAICVSKPKPAILFDNRLVSFYLVRGVGLIEVLQR